MHTILQTLTKCGTTAKSVFPFTVKVIKGVKIGVRAFLVVSTFGQISEMRWVQSLALTLTKKQERNLFVFLFVIVESLRLLFVNYLLTISSNGVAIKPLDAYCMYLYFNKIKHILHKKT